MCICIYYRQGGLVLTLVRALDLFTVLALALVRALVLVRALPLALLLVLTLALRKAGEKQKNLMDNIYVGGGRQWLADHTAYGGMENIQ